MGSHTGPNWAPFGEPLRGQPGGLNPPRGTEQCLLHSSRIVGGVFRSEMSGVRIVGIYNVSEPRIVQDRSEVPRRARQDPEAVPVWIPSGTQMGSKSGPIWDPKWDPIWDPSGTQNGTKRGPIWIQFRSPIGTQFGSHLGPKWGPIWAPFGIQRGAHLGSLRDPNGDGFWILPGPSGHFRTILNDPGLKNVVNSNDPDPGHLRSKDPPTILEEWSKH